MEQIIKSVDNNIEAVIKEREKICEANEKKVLEAFIRHQISEAHLNGTTGYGYGDIGRDAIESVFAEIFKTEDAIVRNQFISGTHTISVTLFGILRPGDIVVSINGKPYDTLDEVIGIRENSSSLKSFGIQYEQVDLKDGKFDLHEIENKLREKKVKLVMIQRSRGYADRDAFLIEEIEGAIKVVKQASPDTIVMVDNCYGEFVDTREPSEVGADVTVGSLIKNIGGGIAKTGGYIVGKKDVIDLISDRYSAPGLGKEGGATFQNNRDILQGLFMAPHIVTEALKTAIFASALLEQLGYEASPKFDAKRSDIVQMIKFQDSEKLIKFCQGIQGASPIDSHVVPEPWDMPGYENKVIMAAGSFVSGSSIELSCDGPLREPYIAYMQGGLTYGYGKIAVIEAVKKIQGDNVWKQ